MVKTAQRCQPVAELPEPTDWDTLFNGTIYELKQGIDYDCTPKTFASIITHKAKVAGVELKIDVDDSRIVVQAIK